MDSDVLSKCCKALHRRDFEAIMMVYPQGYLIWRRSTISNKNRNNLM